MAMRSGIALGEMGSNKEITTGTTLGDFKTKVIGFQGEGGGPGVTSLFEPRNVPKSTAVPAYKNCGFRTIGSNKENARGPIPIPFPLPHPLPLPFPFPLPLSLPTKVVGLEILF